MEPIHRWAVIAVQVAGTQRIHSYKGETPHNLLGLSYSGSYAGYTPWQRAMVTTTVTTVHAPTIK